MKVGVGDTEHGMCFRFNLNEEEHTDLFVEVLATDERHGLWLIVGTGHDAVEVRVTPKGRKVTATDSRLTPPGAQG